LHTGLSAEVAVEEVLESAQLKQDKEFDRMVCIDLPKEYVECFPSTSANTTSVFRLNIVDKPQKILSIVIRTYAGPYFSPRFIIFSLDGEDLVRRIQSAMKVGGDESNLDYVALAKTIAEKLYRDFCVVTGKDENVVLLIRALDSALDKAAKKSEYRSETRILGTLENISRTTYLCMNASNMLRPLDLVIPFYQICY
jgi:hypothetical protein